VFKIVKNNVNVGDLRELAQTILEGRIKTFHLELRKGNKKTKLYAEYTTFSESQLTEDSREVRLSTSETLEEIADGIEAGDKFNTIEITKSLTTDWKILIDRVGSNA